MYLLDTNVISELRRPRPHGAVLNWLNRVHSHQLFLAAVTVGEIQSGIEITRERDLGKASEIENWLSSIVNTHSILPMDAATFREWARLKHRKSDALFEDAMIAATARVHELTVVTRNVRDFEEFNVEVLNPFKDIRVCRKREVYSRRSRVRS